MTSPDRLKDLVKIALDRSGKLDEIKNVVTREVDGDNEDAGLQFPFIEIQQVNYVDENLTNSQKIGNVTDDDGNVIGEAYEHLYSVTLQLNIWTVSGSRHDVDHLGSKLREVLYDYSNRGLNKNLVDQEGRTIETVYSLHIKQHTRVDDVGLNTAVRLYQQNVDISACERYTEYLNGDVVTDYDQTIST